MRVASEWHTGVISTDTALHYAAPGAFVARGTAAEEDGELNSR